MMNNDKDDKLKKVFQTMTWETPSSSFESKLMNRIVRLEQERRKKSRLIYWGSLITACILLVVLSIATLQLTGTEFGKLTKNFWNGILSIDPLYTSIGVTLLFLLLINFILRIQLHQKSEK